MEKPIDTSTLKYGIRLASMGDANEILSVEKAAFGVSIHPEEMRQILEDKIGLVYVARETSTNKIIGYQTILFKNPNEKKLQPLLRDSKSRYMHDDIHLIEEGKEAYLHLLGVLPEFQGKGIAKALLKYVYDELSKRFERITSIIRINNIASMYAVMNVTGAYIDSFQELSQERSKDPLFLGSKETNLNLVRNIKEDRLDNFDINTACVWEDGATLYGADEILVPVIQGEESALSNPSGKELIKKIKILLGKGFKGVNIISLSERSYYYFKKLN